MPLIGSLLVALAPATLFFLGDEGCPDTAAVESQLRRIDPPALDAAAPQFVLIEVHPRGLRVRLFDDQGGLLEERLLEGSRSCAEWAKAAAALLATWEAGVGSADLGLAAQPAGPAPIAASQQVPQRRPPALEGELGLGPTGAIAGDGSAALGGEILLGLSPRAGAWGGQLGFATTTLRSVTIAGGSAHWQRFTLSLGAYGTFGSGALRVDLGAAFLAALLSATGTGFPVTHTASAVDPGIDLTVRLRWEVGRPWRLWIQAGPSFWLKTEQAEVLTGQVVSTATIPSLDLLATLGVSYTFSL